MFLNKKLLLLNVKNYNYAQKKRAVDATRLILIKINLYLIRY